MKLKTKKKSKLEQKEKSTGTKEVHVPISSINKKILAELKAAYKSRLLKFDSEEIAKTILEDKDIRRGLTK